MALLTLRSLCVFFAILLHVASPSSIRPRTFTEVEDLRDHTHIINTARVLVKPYDRYVRFEVYGVSTDCYQCDPQFMLVNPITHEVLPEVITKHPFKFDIKDDNGTSRCVVQRHFHDNGNYTLWLDNIEPDWRCGIYVDDSPPNEAYPVIIFSVCLLALGIVWISLWLLAGARIRGWAMAQQLKEKEHPHGPRTLPILQEYLQALAGWVLHQAHSSGRGTGRLLALDTFRGFCLGIMIFVNYGGGGYWFFQHSSWNGLTIADLVFPWFVFISGVSISIALHRVVPRQGRFRTFLKTIYRFCKVFALGLFLNNGHDLDRWRIPGVLQLIAVAYLGCATIVLLVPKGIPCWGKCTSKKYAFAEGICSGRPLPIVPPRTLNEEISEPRAVNDSPERSRRDGENETEQEFEEVQVLLDKTSPTPSVTGHIQGYYSFPDSVKHPQPELSPLRHFQDIVVYWQEYCIIGAVMVLWLCLTFLVPLPGCPTGYLGPGGIGDHEKYYNCTGGTSGFLSRNLFGEKHIYQTPECIVPYRCVAFDPEGPLAWLTAIILCYIGVHSGRIFVLYRDDLQRIVRLLVWGVFFGLIGGALCGFSTNKGPIPICKNLWSLSFVFALGGMGMILLAGMYILVDSRHWWNGSPFRYVGMNSILIYTLSDLLGNYFPITFWCSSMRDTHVWVLAQNVSGVSTLFAIAYVCYLYGVFVAL